MVTVEDEDDHHPFLSGSPSADGDSLYVAKRSFYENGVAYFKEATKYFAYLNEDLRRHDKQIVMESMYTEINSKSYHERESSF